MKKFIQHTNLIFTAWNQNHSERELCVKNGGTGM